MPNIKLYARKNELKKDGTAPLVAAFSHGGKQSRLNIGESFPPDLIVGNSLNPGKDRKLQEIAKRVRDILSYIEIEVEKGLTAGLDVHEHIKNRLNERSGKAPQRKKEIPTDMETLFGMFVEKCKKKTNEKTNELFSEGTISVYNVTYNHIKEMSKKMNLDVTKLDGSFYDEFRDYMMHVKGNGMNTVSKYIAIIKGFMDWCDEYLKSFGVQISYQYKKFKVTFSFEDPVHLKSHELLMFYNYIPKNKKHELSKDMFLMMCYTGLSFTDLMRIGRENIHGDMILSKRKKTKNRCIIPFFDDDIFKPVELMEKYDYKFPRVDNMTINRHLKAIQKKIKFDRFEVTTKIGRKTFATIKHLEHKVPSHIVMRATGHKSESNFLKYIGIDEESIIDSFRYVSQSQKTT